MLYKLSEWQGATGIWYCNCTDSLTTNASCWYAPARLLNITPADFIKLIINEYGADVIKYFPETGFVSFGWTDQVKMRKYKNFINSIARQKNFQI